MILKTLTRPWLIVIILGLLLSACIKKSEKIVYIPLYTNNQSCISNYLHKVHFLKDDENMNLKQFPFDINVPNSVIGLLEMRSDDSRDIVPIYNGIRTFCFPDIVSKKMSRTDDEWQELAGDIKAISDGVYTGFESKSPLYVEVDLENKKYSLFQSRANKFNSEK